METTVRETTTLRYQPIWTYGNRDARPILASLIAVQTQFANPIRFWISCSSFTIDGTLSLMMVIDIRSPHSGNLNYSAKMQSVHEPD